MKDRVIVFFTRIPTLNKTKTRLEPFLGKDLCIRIQTAFIKDIYNNIKDMGIDIMVNYSEHGNLEILENIMHRNIYFLKQQGNDLGEKMHNAISFSLKQYENVVLIGSDLPLMNKNDVETAFNILETKDIVISPTFDGGYYLIGMKEENREIFDIKYSTSSVFEKTIDKIKSKGKSYGIGNIQLDIDNKKDFIRLHKILKENKNIPCYNTRKLVGSIMKKRDKNE